MIVIIITIIIIIILGALLMAVACRLRDLRLLACGVPHAMCDL